MPTPPDPGPATPPPETTVSITTSTPDGTSFTFRLGEYETQETTYKGRPVSIVSLRNSQRLKVRNHPALPCWRTNLIVPEGVELDLSVQAAEYEEVACAAPMPSAGFVSRDPERQLPPPEFGPVYAGTSPFPEEQALLTADYRIRHVRGVGVVLRPFQYFPSRGILRVYTRIDVELATRPDGEKTQACSFPARFKSNAFAAAAYASFVNADIVFRGTGTETGSAATAAVSERSDELDEEPERLLIVVPDAFEDTVADFAEWKRQRGFVVEIARYPTDTGSGSAALGTFLQTSYQNDSTAFVIFIGDGGPTEDIPVIDDTENPSDAIYTMVSGDDYYHDLFISRISASTEAAILNQLTKIVNYEKTPSTGGDADWYDRAVTVASDEGRGTSSFGMADKEILALEADKLLAAGYSSVNEIYDPGATAEAVIAAWNDGRSLIYYLGHGSDTAWSTTGLSVGDVNGSLSNGTKLPFVVNANCLNGNFTRSSGDCLAEAMLKAGTTTTPSGAIAAVASTTSMDWDPPVVMVQAFTGYLTDQSPFEAGEDTYTIDQTITTAGGLTTFSVQRAMDWCYSGDGDGADAAELIAEQVHLFGDCTLGVRTRAPMELTVTHAPQAIPGGTFSVQVNGDDSALEGARVCLYRAGDVQVVGTTDANGGCDLDLDLIVGDPLTLTVYHRNAVPYQADVEISDGTLVVYSNDVLPNAFVGEAYSFTHTAFGGETPYSWAITEGGADWLGIDDATGTVSGTPTASGTVSYTVEVTDNAEATASQAVTISVGTPVQITTTALPDGTVNAAYDTTIAATGDFTPFAFSLTSGALPQGLALATDGSLTGTPTVAGDCTFTVEATDAESRSDSRQLTISIASSDVLEITTRPTLSAGQRNAYYATIFSASGGSGSDFTWSLTAGALPPGLTLTPTGTLSGTPTLEGTYVFTLQVEDDDTPSHTDSVEFTLNVTSSVYFTTTTLPAGMAGIAYDQPVPVGGSYTPFTYSLPSSGDYEDSTQANTFAETGVLQSWRTSNPYTDNEWDLDFGFTFPYFGTNYTSCRVGNNGYLVFGGSTPAPNHWEATTVRFANLVMIAPFWTDLVITDGYPESGIWLDQQADHVTIRWKGLDYHYVDGVVDAGDPENPEDWVNVAVTLYDTGRIEFHYGSVQTSNRIVVGISNGNGSDYDVLLSHDWYSSSPQYLDGWSQREDYVYDIPTTFPDWLTLTEDGHIQGTPPAIGDYTFMVTVTDTEDNAVSSNLTLAVTETSDPDPNGDGDIDNDEILSYIDLWAAGIVGDDDVNAAVATWRGGPSSRASRSTTPSTASESVLTQGLSGNLEVEVDMPGWRTEMDALTQAGFNVIGRDGEYVTFAVTDDQYDELLALGYTPRIVSGSNSDSGRDRGPPAGYHTYSDVTAELAAYEAAYPTLCAVSSLGQSVDGREIWAIKLTDNPDIEEDEPEVKYVSTIHGNEALVTEMCMYLIEHLLTNYGGDDAAGLRATELLDNTEVWIVPLMNPDGLQNGTRTNANSVDMNRNFPDGALNDIGTFYPDATVDTSGVEPEVAAVMAWSTQHNFIVSCGLHTGALLVCYPYGNNADQVTTETPTPDDALFKYISKQYTVYNSPMWNGSYPDGITNSCAWYAVDGEMADWNYRFLGTLETTAELANTKQPDSSTFDSYWDDNRDSMLSYLECAHIGIRGLVTEAGTGDPLWAEVRVQDNDRAMYTDPDVGDFHRPLLPGTYTIEISSPGYLTQTVEDVVVDDGDAVRVDVALQRDTLSCTRTLGHAKFKAGAANLVHLSASTGVASGLNAYIVTEQLPDGWAYCADSTVSETRSQLDEPRLDNGNCSWLFWGDSVEDTAYSYSVDAPADAAAQVSFDGSIQTSSATQVTAGDTSWDPLLETECLLKLEPGWNLLSVPLTLDSPAVGDALGDAPVSVVWGWDGTAYFIPKLLEPKEGYWVFAEDDAFVLLSGQPPADPLRLFAAGWNLFGPLADRAVLGTRQFPAPAFSWDNELGDYVKATELQECLGYWIFSATENSVDLR